MHTRKGEGPFRMQGAMCRHGCMCCALQAKLRLLRMKQDRVRAYVDDVMTGGGVGGGGAPGGPGARHGLAEAGGAYYDDSRDVD